MQVLQAVGQRASDLDGPFGEDRVGDRDAGLAEEVVLALALARVLLFQRGGDEEVSGSAGGVADGDVQERGNPLLGGPVCARLVQQGVERGVQQAFDQRGRRVVGARLFPLVAGQYLQRVGQLFVVVAGYQLQQRLVHTAQFLRTQ